MEGWKDDGGPTGGAQAPAAGTPSRSTATFAVPDSVRAARASCTVAGAMLRRVAFRHGPYVSHADSGRTP